MTFAEIKRACRVGTKVTMTHYGNFGPGDTLSWGGGARTLPFTRPIAKVKTTAVAFEETNAKAGESWLYWPAAREVTINADGTFSLKGMTYRIEPSS